MRSPPGTPPRRALGPALLAVGGILLNVGAVLAVLALTPTIMDETVTIPEGREGHAFFRIWVLDKGEVAGSFATTGPEVYLRVFTADEYARYVQTGGATTLYSLLSTSGQFEVPLPVTGSYYVVFSHWDFGPRQRVRVLMVVTGIDPIQLAVGIPLAPVGAVVARAGQRRIASWDRAVLATPATALPEPGPLPPTGP